MPAGEQQAEDRCAPPGSQCRAEGKGRQPGDRNHQQGDRPEPRHQFDEGEDERRTDDEPRPLAEAAEALPTREQQAVHDAKCYIRSGASTPTRSRQRAMTDRVARQRPSRKDSCSLSSTRCSW